MPFMYCSPPAAIVRVIPATGDSHAGLGEVVLSSGASFRITTPYGEPSPDRDFVVKMRRGDHVQMCYGPAQHWADADPSARMAIIGDLDDSQYFYGLANPGR